MKTPLLSILVLLVGQFPAHGQTTNISGVVNSYHKVLEVLPADACVRVQSTSGLSINDQVMIVQMKGATINTDNTSSFGDITAINNAGNYEINHVCDIKGDSVFLSYTILNNYTTAGKVQLVKIPVYQDAVVTDSLKAAPWNNSTGLGGVLALKVGGQLTLNAPISASGAGFKGGNFVTSTGLCSNFARADNFYYNANNSNPQNGGFKGEGVYEFTNLEYSGGRGALANGGGGGNNHNNSGGGGANLSSGGIGGGNSSSVGCLGNFEGSGGKSLNSNSGQKIYLGGGGGAGHANNTTVSTGGGYGGGIIFIQAVTIVGNNQKILANGKVGGNTTGDGASGGGAGGTIILSVTNYTGTLTIEANGGKGGNEDNEFINGRCYGGGGGGSGGVIYFNNTPPAIYSVSGGTNGAITNSLNCPSLINGLPGAVGQYFTNYNYRASSTMANDCGLVLPVRLISFTAKNSLDKTSLTWEIDNLPDLKKFEVEHSINHINWNIIKTMYTNGSIRYQYIHQNVSLGNNLYRLKIYNANGTFYFSKIEKVIVGASKKFSVFPNPAKSNLFVTGDFKPFSLIHINDVSGKTLLIQKVTDHKAVQRVSINEIPAGIYLIKVEDQVQKIIIY